MTVSVKTLNGNKEFSFDNKADMKQFIYTLIEMKLNYSIRRL